MPLIQQAHQNLADYCYHALDLLDHCSPHSLCLYDWYPLVSQYCFSAVVGHEPLGDQAEAYGEEWSLPDWGVEFPMDLHSGSCHYHWALKIPLPASWSCWRPYKRIHISFSKLLSRCKAADRKSEVILYTRAMNYAVIVLLIPKGGPVVSICPSNLSHYLQLSKTTNIPHLIQRSLLMHPTSLHNISCQQILANMLQSVLQAGKKWWTDCFPLSLLTSNSNSNATAMLILVVDQNSLWSYQLSCVNCEKVDSHEALVFVVRFVGVWQIPSIYQAGHQLMWIIEDLHCILKVKSL